MARAPVCLGSAGASAAIQGRRAQRRAARRRVLCLVLVALGLALVFAGWGRVQAWLVGPGLLAGAGAWQLRPERDPGRWGRGAAGEVMTAQMLGRLPRRYVVLHDRRPPWGGGNVDHLVIGPSGVWLIDSKVRRAPIRIRRGQVWAGDTSIDVGAAARQRDRLTAVLGTPVTAVVAIHGTGLRRRGRDMGGVRVVPAHRLVHRLRRGRRLSPSEVAALAARADAMCPCC